MKNKPFQYSMQGGVIVVLVLIIIISFQFQRSSAIATDKEPDKCLYINEVLTDNIGGLRDEEGDYNDWIEIYNYGEAAINLEGYGLTDDLDEPFKWNFENMIIEPGEYLVIRATGKDRQASKEYIHTNFSLSKEGETLQLTHKDSEAIDTISIPKLDQNISVGRKNSSDNTIAILNKATPGQGNYVSVLKNVIQEQPLEMPKFSHEAGFYQEGFQLELWTEDDDITIYYTLDGSEPDVNSKVYTKPIKIKYDNQYKKVLGNIKTTEIYPSTTLKVGEDDIYKANVIKARTYKNGVYSDRVITNTYFINPHYTLPIISLSTDRDNLFGHEEGIYVPGRIYDLWASSNSEYINGLAPTNYHQKSEEWEREVYLEYFKEDGTRDISQTMGVRIFGGWSRMNQVKSLKLIAKENYGKDRVTYDIFSSQVVNQYDNSSIKNFKNFLLRSSGNDFNSTMLRDAIQQRIIKNTGLATQGYSPAIVFINGEYWGIHNIRETYDEYYLENHYGVNKADVVILEANRGLQTMEADEENDIYAEEYMELMNFITTEDMSIPENYNYVTSKIDIDNFIKYTLCELYFGNSDWTNNNIKCWKDKADTDSKWQWLIYDLDMGFSEEKIDVYEDSKNKNRSWSLLPIDRLIANEEFRNLFIQYSLEYLDTIFQPEYVKDIIYEMAAVIEPEIEEHFKRWEFVSSGIGSILHKLKGISPHRTDWYSEIEIIINFAEERPQYFIEFLQEYFGLIL
ncbi:CotH kinase family protein [Clostridium culturomicium]|uniref:CotH kinase family protein n=1 Tax=Clostridium culturomicium TaxID=1499683 RepID=UPI003857C27D